MSLMTELIPWSRARGTDMVRETRDPFMRLQRDINRMFDDAWRGFDLPMAPGAAVANWPKVELHEEDKQLTLTAELPGMTEKDVEILLEDDVLTLRGERREQRSDNDNGRYFSERYYGRFERRIPLDCKVQADKVEASFNDGLLTIDMPKAADAKPRGKRIAIKAH